jgi:hypothetical protein
MPLPSSWVVVVIRRYHYSTHQNQPGSYMSVPLSERIELPLYTHSYACFHKQNMYDEKLNWNKSSTRATQDFRTKDFMCSAQDHEDHDSKFQTNAKVWNNLISNLESKAKVITCGRIWYGGLILAVRNKNSHSNTRVPKFSQISPTTQWHNYAHFWYSKIDLDWIGICSKNFICSVMLL